jgi:hypothetical protein
MTRARHTSVTQFREPTLAHSVRWVDRVKVLVLAALVGCAPPSLRTAPELRPSLRSDADMYIDQIVALRTTLGRAGIALEARGVVRAVASPSCGDGPSHGNCARCELGADISTIDGAKLEAITAAFDRYPTDVLAAAHIDRVALCRRIDYDADDPAGLDDSENRRIFISLEPFAGTPYDPFANLTIEDIVHHEYFHQLEFTTMPSFAEADPAWDLLNPADFHYTNGNPTSATRPDGFVDPYATKNAQEDRASVFEYVMARPDELCELAHHDEVVRAKVALIWERVSSVTDAKYLRARAACVDWIDDWR